MADAEGLGESADGKRPLEGQLVQNAEPSLFELNTLGLVNATRIQVDQGAEASQARAERRPPHTCHIVHGHQTPMLDDSVGPYVFLGKFSWFGVMTFQSVNALCRRSVVAGLGAGALTSHFTRVAHAGESLDALVQRQMGAAKIPGLALGLAQDGRTVFARGYGTADVETNQPVNADTVFHIASITKTVTALAVMMLVEDGRISLDQPVSDWLDFDILGDPGRAITWRHLLMHTSGISDRVYYEIDFRQRGRDSELALPAFLRAYLQAGGQYAASGNVLHTPGTRWDYCNVGYGLLGHLADRVTGQDFRDWIAERLFAPLDLTRSMWRLRDIPANAARPYEIVDDTIAPTAPVGFPDWPAGMLRTSVSDLTRLMAAVANGGNLTDHKVLSAANTTDLLTMHRPAGLPDWLVGQGLGWQQSLLDGAPRLNHWGGDPGVFTMAYVDPPTRSAVVVLSNLSATSASRDALKAIVSAGFQSLQ